MLVWLVKTEDPCFGQHIEQAFIRLDDAEAYALRDLEREVFSVPLHEGPYRPTHGYRVDYYGNICKAVTDGPMVGVYDTVAAAEAQAKVIRARRAEEAGDSAMRSKLVDSIVAGARAACDEALKALDRAESERNRP